MPQPSAAYRLARSANQADYIVAAAHRKLMVFFGHWSTLFMQCKVYSGKIAIDRDYVKSIGGVQIVKAFQILRTCGHRNGDTGFGCICANDTTGSRNTRRSICADPVSRASAANTQSNAFASRAVGASSGRACASPATGLGDFGCAGAARLHSVDRTRGA
jgi:hypothetical protein